jgi:hypothetical protein
MTNFICVECGTQFEQTIALPLRCPICEDERQYVRHDGQQWTTLNELRGPHRNKFEDEAPQLYRRLHSGRRGPPYLLKKLTPRRKDAKVGPEITNLRADRFGLCGLSR